MVFYRRDVYSLAPDHPIITWYAKAVQAMLADDTATGWAHQAAIHGTYTTPPPALANECRHPVALGIAIRAVVTNRTS